MSLQDNDLTLTTPTKPDTGVPAVADVGIAQYQRAGQWRLAWWKFKRHRLAVAGGVVVLFVYFVAAFAEFLAPQGPGAYTARYTYAPPQRLHFWDETGFNLHANGYKVAVNKQSFAREFVVDPQQKIPVGLFVRGAPYQLWGLIPSDIHLIGPLDPRQPMYLWGAVPARRDMLSRVIHGTRISMTIGLLGVCLSLFFGVLLGGLSGYYGGQVDNIIQRIIEFLLAISTIPLWMGLAANPAVPFPPSRFIS